MINIVKPKISLLSAVFFLPFFVFSAGCNTPKDNLETFNKTFKLSNYDQSALFAQRKISKNKKPKAEDLLWTLQLGSIERIRKNHQKSTEYFDKAEDMLKYFDQQGELGEAIAATAINENIIAYKGEEYDGIMVNIYKALNFMAEGKMDLARVEFNRALDRQRRAKILFNEEIKKLNTEIERENQKNANVKANVENPQTRTLLSRKYPNLYNFEAYPDFVNPFATYLAGIFFEVTGDYSRASDLFKESCGMVKDNSYVTEDFVVIENILEGKAKAKDTVWIIFENGLGPVKKEFRIDLPLFIVTRHVKYVGIALPKLEFRTRAYPYLSIRAGNIEYKTCTVADMDRVIQTEFSKDFNGILTRAIISATAKATAQYLFEQQNSSAGSFASIAAAVYSFVTTAADVRIWTALPKNFQVCRLEKPQNGKITITPPGSIPFNIDISNCSSAIVYVKIITSQSVPVYEVMTF